MVNHAISELAHIAQPLSLAIPLNNLDPLLIKLSLVQNQIDIKYLIYHLKTTKPLYLHHAYLHGIMPIIALLLFETDIKRLSS